MLNERVAAERNYRDLDRVFVEWLVRHRCRRADRIIAVSEDVAREIERLGALRERIVVIPNAIDVGDRCCWRRSRSFSSDAPTAQEREFGGTPRSWPR